MAGQFYPKIAFFIQIIVEWVRDIGREYLIEIIGHCERLQRQSKNKNKICILASEQATVC
jgi:hypothetical protein